jgi:hypothetical protein
MPIFKSIISFFLILALLSQTLITGITLVEFQTNRQYYADVLCINKNRPELACQGKCVLMQRLNNEFEQNNDAERQALQHIFDNELTLFYDFTNAFNLNNKLIFNNQKGAQTIHYQFFIPQSFLKDIFHPPTATV